MKIRSDISTSYREFYSASKLFTNSILQFKYDGYALKAQLSAPVSKLQSQQPSTNYDLYKKLVALRVICPQINGFILHKTQLDDIKILESKVKQVLSQQ